MDNKKQSNLNQKKLDKEPKQRSYFEMTDTEKQEIMDKAAKDSNDAQQSVISEMESAEQKACECSENCLKDLCATYCTCKKRSHGNVEWTESSSDCKVHYPAPSLNTNYYKEEQTIKILPNPSLNTWEKDFDKQFKIDFDEMYDGTYNPKGSWQIGNVYDHLKQFISSQISLAVQKERKDQFVNVNKMIEDAVQKERDKQKWVIIDGKDSLYVDGIKKGREVRVLASIIVTDVTISNKGGEEK